MSNFDLLIGLGKAPLDQLSSALFSKPEAKDKIFKQTIIKPLEGFGQVTLQYEIIQAPTFDLNPVSDDQWNQAIKAKGITNKPTNQTFSLIIPKLTANASFESGKPLSGEGALTIICTLNSTPGTIDINPVAVLMDQSNFTLWDKFIVNNLLVPQLLETIKGMLTGLGLPSIPEIEGVAFTPAIAQVQEQFLLIASNVEDNSQPIDLSGEQWPAKTYFILFSQHLIESGINQFTTQFNGQSFAGSESKGDKIAGEATVKYSGKLNNVTGEVITGDLTKYTISVRADLTADGSISGVIPTLLCPVGTALNAL